MFEQLIFFYQNQINSSSNDVNADLRAHEPADRNQSDDPVSVTRQPQPMAAGLDGTIINQG